MDSEYAQPAKGRVDNEDMRSAMAIAEAGLRPYLPTRYSRHFVIHPLYRQKNGWKIVVLKDRLEGKK
jgi:hypothetical protein